MSGVVRPLSATLPRIPAVRDGMAQHVTLFPIPRRRRRKSRCSRSGRKVSIPSSRLGSLGQPTKFLWGNSGKPNDEAILIAELARGKSFRPLRPGLLTPDEQPFDDRLQVVPAAVQPRHPPKAQIRLTRHDLVTGITGNHSPMSQFQKLSPDLAHFRGSAVGVQGLSFFYLSDVTMSRNLPCKPCRF